MLEVNLLGDMIPISVETGAERDVDAVFDVIQKAAGVLNEQFGSGQLNGTWVKYVKALRGLGVAAHRGFTPCEGTAETEDGEFVFFIGAEDVALNADPLWYASTIIHDGGHAWLSQQGQPSTGVEVEETLTQVQIDYFTLFGDRPTYIENLVTYKNSPEMIMNRINQPV